MTPTKRSEFDKCRLKVEGVVDTRKKQLGIAATLGLGMLIAGALAVGGAYGQALQPNQTAGFSGGKLEHLHAEFRLR